jgi:hypothetical protein
MVRETQIWDAFFSRDPPIFKKSHGFCPKMRKKALLARHSHILTAWQA